MVRRRAGVDAVTARVGHDARRCYRRRWSFLPISIALPSICSKLETGELGDAEAMAPAAPADRPVLAAVSPLLPAARRSAARAAGRGGMVFRLWREHA